MWWRPPVCFGHANDPYGMLSSNAGIVDQIKIKEMGVAMGQAVAPATVKLDSGLSVVLFCIYLSIISIL